MKIFLQGFLVTIFTILVFSSSCLSNFQQDQHSRYPQLVHAKNETGRLLKKQQEIKQQSRILKLRRLLSVKGLSNSARSKRSRGHVVNVDKFGAKAAGRDDSKVCHPF